MRRFYNLVFPFIFLLLLPGYLRRMFRRGNYRENFWQRFGYYSPEVRRRLHTLSRPVWLQAVSVGEMLVALKLVAALRAQTPDLPLVISTTTTTGYALAKERVPADVEVLYTPVDLAGAVKRFFEEVQPSQLVVVDGGLWPNQLWQARRRGIRTALVNARLSPRSERRFRRFPGIAGALYGLLDLVCVVEDADQRRWASLGVETFRIQLTGSIKFDGLDLHPRTANISPASDKSAAPSEKRAILARLGVGSEDPVLLGGSTHPGEEVALAEAFLNLKKQFPTLFLVVAPRHVERSAEVQTDLAGLGLTVARRTLLDDAPESPDMLLLDTTGELSAWYPTATLAFIGKSLLAIGGQNPGEAVQAGVPVIFGPHMENFADLVSALLATNAAAQVADVASLEERCRELLANPTERARMIAAASAQIAVHRGAAARTASLLLEGQKSACAAR